MAHTPYTGKSVGVLLTWNAVAVPKWKKLVIDEQAGPLPAQLDKTNAASSGYESFEDPMGSKGNPKTTVTIDGLASKTDVADTGVFSHAMNDAHALVFQAATGAGHDKFTITPELTKRSRPAEIGTLTPYTLTFELEAAGTWISSPS